MLRDELNSFVGIVAILAVLAILVILLAVLALVVVKALVESLWGVFSVGATIPSALCLGTTIILRMQLGAPRTASSREEMWQRAEPILSVPQRSPWLALLTLLPLIWLVEVAFKAGVQKIFHPDPRSGVSVERRH